MNKEHQRRILLLILLFLLTAGPVNAGWFDNKEEKLLIEAKEQLEKERQNAEIWQLRASALAIGCVSLLIVGTILGSHTRRAHARRTQASSPHE